MSRCRTMDVGCRMCRPRPLLSAFTIIELLIAIATIALLIGLLLPSLAGAREAARSAQCLSTQRQLVIGWSLYAHDHKGRAMPLAEEQSAQPIYWWGAVIPGGNPVVDHARGFLAAYLEAGLGERSAYECPSQPWGTYRAQPAALQPPQPTSTYGYNGYYLCPPKTPGWNLQIGGQPWRRLDSIENPSLLFVFADALLEGSPPRNTALLDPPELFSSGAWNNNPSPTTAFRHGHASAIAANADGSASAHSARPEWLTSPTLRIGSIGVKNDPHYVPDWKRWR
jgi:competence protein ComGC